MIMKSLLACRVSLNHLKRTCWMIAHSRNSSKLHLLLLLRHKLVIVESPVPSAPLDTAAGRGPKTNASNALI